MGKAKEKELSMRQQLRVKAESELVSLKKEAFATLDELCRQEGIDRGEFIKALSVGHHKTAEHILVTQLANRYEAELVKLWNDQQTLPLKDPMAEAGKKPAGGEK